jgi:hypothetical protein
MAENDPPKTPGPGEDSSGYWNRLSEKFAAFGGSPRPAPVQTAATSDPAPVSGDATPTRSGIEADTPGPTAVPVAHTPTSSLAAEAFAALLALEDGQPGARPVRLKIGDDEPKPQPDPVMTDAMIEDVVRRVVERLGPDAVRAVVADVVSEIAERLVKEEIDRIRNQHV